MQPNIFQRMHARPLKDCVSLPLQHNCSIPLRQRQAHNHELDVSSANDCLVCMKRRDGTYQNSSYTNARMHDCAARVQAACALT
jgi:hypothetical protein